MLAFTGDYAIGDNGTIYYELDYGAMRLNAQRDTGEDPTKGEIVAALQESGLKSGEDFALAPNEDETLIEGILMSKKGILKIAKKAPDEETRIQRIGFIKQLGIPLTVDEEIEIGFHG